MPRLRPLTREEMPEFEDQFREAEARGRHVSNLARTLARRPDIVKAHRVLRKTIMGPGTVAPELKTLISTGSEVVPSGQEGNGGQSSGCLQLQHQNFNSGRTHMPEL